MAHVPPCYSVHMADNFRYTDPGFNTRPRSQQKGRAGFAEFLMRKGIVRTRAQAQYVLLAVAVGAIALTFFIWPHQQTPVSPPPPVVAQ